MLLFFSLLFADPNWSAIKALDAKKIEKHTQYLASDELEGRGTGTEGEKKAADYIAEHFKKAGLKPLAGDSFFQKIELVGYKKDAANSSLTIQGPNGPLNYKNEENLTYWSSSQKASVKLSDAPLVFVGYGVEAPEYKWDDYKGLDCKGKILVFLNNDPPVAENGRTLFEGERRTYYGRWTYKFEQAMQRGAAGAIMIHTTPSAGYGWSVVGHSGQSEGFALKLPGSGYQVDFLAWMHQDLADQIAKASGHSLDKWFEMGKSRDFSPVELPFKLTTDMSIKMRETQSQNVVGLLEGTDLKDEMIVFTAHYDHLGKGSGEGDTIFNGAWDNALGTACIMEMASSLSQSGKKARRSFVFVAAAAEEKGSLGSRWFVNKPMVPAKQFVANLNIDMPQILGVTRDLTAIGRDSNSLGPALSKAAKSFADKMGGEVVTIKEDQNPNAGSFYRSDQVNFAKAGIPALFLNPGTEYVNQPKVNPKKYKGEHYHQPADEINDAWDLAGCTRDMQITLLLAWDIANADKSPRWNPGNEFESAWKKLHGQH